MGSGNGGGGAFMGAITDAIGAVFEAFIGMVSDVLGLFTTSGNEILLVALVLPLAGVAITIVKRLMSVRL